MKKTKRLFTKGQNAKFYKINYNPDTIEWDFTWRMQIDPYPPEPSFQFIVEDTGEITKILEVWEAHFESLFYYAENADLLDNDFGKMWYDFCWIGNCDDDWLLDNKDIKDLISILETVPLYELSSKEKEGKYISEVQELTELRDFLIKFLTTILSMGRTVYFRRD